MEELKALLDLLKDLPNTAAIALLGFLIYKLSVVASIYATVRFVVSKLVEGYVAKVSAPKPSTNLAGLRVINEAVGAEIAIQLNRLTRMGYLHTTDVVELKTALDEHFKKGVKNG